MSLHPVVERVTSRIVEKSAVRRAAYLVWGGWLVVTMLVVSPWVIFNLARFEHPVVDELRELARVGDGVDRDLAYFDGAGHGFPFGQVVSTRLDHRGG